MEYNSIEKKNSEITQNSQIKRQDVTAYLMTLKSRMWQRGLL